MPNPVAPVMETFGDSGTGLPASPCCRTMPNVASFSVWFEIIQVCCRLNSWLRNG